MLTMETTFYEQFKSLRELCQWLRKQNSSNLQDKINAGELDLRKLPVFGGKPPTDIDYISYDVNSILIEYQTCDQQIHYGIVRR